MDTFSLPGGNGRPKQAAKADFDIRSAIRITACLFLVWQVLVGCGPSRESLVTTVPPAVPAEPSPVPAQPPSGSTLPERWFGYFVGTVGFGDNSHYGEALLTVDGSIRMYIGGPSEDEFDAKGSMQFVGQFNVDGEQATGTGMIIGQHCGEDPDPLCAAPTPGDIDLTLTDAASPTQQRFLTGGIEFTTSGEEVHWAIDMALSFSSYELSSRVTYMNGHYGVELAEFARQDDVIISIDSTGELFFQSPESGCVGNGILSPYRSSESDLLYDVDMTIGACTGNYGHLNGPFEGLAFREADRRCVQWIRFWLASPNEAPTPVAITMWANNEAGVGCWDY